MWNKRKNYLTPNKNGFKVKFVSCLPPKTKEATSLNYMNNMKGFFNVCHVEFFVSAGYINLVLMLDIILS